MEASEKPQLPLEPDASDGAVRAIGDRLVIESLTITDERAAGIVRERQRAGQEPAKTVADAIEIGVRVLDREDTGAEVEFVKNEFERQAGELGKQLGETIGSAGEGINETVDTASEKIVEQLASHFDPERRSAIQNQIREALGQFGQEQLRAIMRVFSAEDGANPLADFKQGVVRAVKDVATRQQAENEALRTRLESLTNEVVRLREQDDADRRVAEAEEAGTRKGRSFEERVHEVIDEIATARGDVAHHVGDQVAETRGKKGDTVIEIGAGSGPCLAKIAFDPKDSQLTRPKAWDVLNGSLEDRGADYAVLVVASEENVPAKTHSLVEYEGNKLIVAVDREDPERNILEAAYGIARARALAARQDELALDAPAMKEAIEEARRALEALKTARQALTGVRKNADSIESALAGLEETAKAALARADSLIADALEASS